MRIAHRILQAVKDYGRPESDWDGSTFESLLQLSPDTRGQIGENLTAAILKDFGCEVDDAEIGKTTRGGERGYDLKADGIRLEVKLATRGRKANSFQHENLNRREQWDALVLIDIAPDKVYVTITAKDDLPWDTMHQRHSSAYYKYDISVQKHEKAGNMITSDREFFEKFQAVKLRILQGRR